MKTSLGVGRTPTGPAAQTRVERGARRSRAAPTRSRGAERISPPAYAQTTTCGASDPRMRWQHCTPGELWDSGVRAD
jgi:hypothetical protein